MFKTIFLPKQSLQTLTTSFFVLFSTCFLVSSISLSVAATQTQTSLSQTIEHAAINTAINAAAEQVVNEGWRYYLSRVSNGCKQSWNWTKEHKEEFKSAGMLSLTTALVVMAIGPIGPAAFFGACGKGAICGTFIEMARQVFKNDTPTQQLPQAPIPVQAVPVNIHVNDHMPGFIIREVNELTFDLRRMDNDFHQFRQETTANFADVRNNISQVRQDVHGLNQRVGSIEAMVRAVVSHQQRRPGALPPTGNRVIVEEVDDDKDEQIIPRQNGHLAVKGQQTELIDLDDED